MEPFTLTALGIFLAPYLQKAGKKVAEKTVENLFESREDLAKKFSGLFNREIITLGLNDSVTAEEAVEQLEANYEVKTEIDTKVAANRDLLNELVEAFKQMPRAEFSGITLNTKKIGVVNISDTSAQNLGTQLNAPQAPVTITNFFGGEKSQLDLLSNIPAAKGFVGREDELKALRKAKQDGKTSFVLHGCGGVGKTALALKFIEEIKGEFHAHIRVHMQGLANALSPNDAMLEVIRAFKPDVPSLPPEQIESLYISLLNQYEPLLFFDNAKNRNQVEPLNQKAAFVVITSRATFNVSGGCSEKVGQMSDEDAERLLYSIADEARFDGKAGELAKLAGYLPMALLPLAGTLAEDITEDMVLLIEKYSNRKERLRLSDPNRENLSIEASFALSYESLDLKLREYWQKLVIFPLDFELQALKAIWQNDNIKEFHSALVRHNLIIYDVDSKRSRLHDLARDYLNEKLSENERLLTGRLHACHYGGFLKGLKKMDIENIKGFDLERLNIEQGYEWIENNKDVDASVASIIEDYTGNVSVIPILLLRLEAKTFLKRMELGYEVSKKTGNRECENLCLGRIGITYKDSKSYTIALAFHLKALEIARSISHHFGESLHLGNCGVCYRRMKNYQKAISFHEEAFRISKNINDRQLEMLWSSNLGLDYLAIKDLNKAVDYLENALLISNEIDDALGKSFIMQNLGDCYHRLGHFQKSIELNNASLELSREIVDGRSEIKRLNSLGESYRKLGDKEKAKLHFKEAFSKLERKNSSHAKMVRGWLEEMKDETENDNK